MGHLVDVVVLHVEALELLVQLLRRGRPHRIGMRIVRLPGDVVDPDLVAQRDPDRIRDETRQEKLPEHLRRPLAPEILPRPGRMHVKRAVDPLQEVRDPPRAPSLNAILISGKFLITRDHNRSAAADWMFIGCNVIITSGGESNAGIANFPDDPKCTDNTVAVSHNARHNGSQ